MPRVSHPSIDVHRPNSHLPCRTSSKPPAASSSNSPTRAQLPRSLGVAQGQTASCEGLGRTAPCCCNPPKTPSSHASGLFPAHTHTQKKKKEKQNPLFLTDLSSPSNHHSAVNILFYPLLQAARRLHKHAGVIYLEGGPRDTFSSLNSFSGPRNRKRSAAKACLQAALMSPNLLPISVC